MMKTINYIKAFGIIALFGASVAANAQEEGVNALNREMTLEREYDPSVQDANKVNSLPVVKEPEIRKIPIDYASFTLPATPAKEFNILPSGNVMTAMEYNKNRGYLNLAGGTYLNLNGDFGYRILDTDKDKLNIFVSHRSSNGKVKYLQYDEKIKAKLNDNLGGLHYRHSFDKAIFKIGAEYGYSAFNYYGLPMVDRITSLPSSEEVLMTPADRETNQVAQTINFFTGIQSKEGAEIGYLLDLNYINFGYKYGLGKIADGPTENTFAARFDLNAALSNGHRVGLGGQVKYFNYGLPPEVERPGGGYYYISFFDNYAEMMLSPYYRMEGRNWNLQLGANVMYYTGDHNKFMVSPNILADVTVADRTVLYLQAKGELRSNSMYDLSRINRYVNPTVEIYPTRNWLDGNLGIRSGIAAGFWFDVFGGYKVNSDDFFFVPSRIYWENDFGNFSNDMGGMNTRMLFVGADLKYNYQQIFEIRLKGVYNHWEHKFGDDWVGGAHEWESGAYGRPKMEITAGVTVRPIRKAAIDLNYYLATGRETRLFGATDYKFDNINELNLTASYEINKTFGAYVKLNNLLFQKYELYYGYPMQKFNAMVGININF